MRKVRQTIPLLKSYITGEIAHIEVKALEIVPGLIVHANIRVTNWDSMESSTLGWNVTHAPSGLLIQPQFTSALCAARYARAIADVTDWTQDKETLKRQRLWPTIHEIRMMDAAWRQLA